MNMVNQAIGMIDIAEKQGHALLKCDSVEEAEKLINVISPMIEPSEEGLQFAVTRIRDREVNIYSIRQMPSEEEQERILWQNKKRYWKKQAEELKLSKRKWWNSQKKKVTPKSRWSKSSSPL